MKHLDEHTIELYILGSDLVKGQIGEIEAHLKECHGCRSLAEQMKVFYEKAESELETSHHVLPDMTEAIVRKQASMELSNETFWSPVHYPEKNLLAKFWYFVYRHPIPAMIGGFAMVAGSAWMINFALSTFTKDTNPIRSKYNTNEDILEVYNSKGEILFRELSNSLTDIEKFEEKHLVESTLINDLNADGTNEVITTIPNYNDENKQQRSLRIIDYGNNKNIKKSFNEPFNYLGKNYSPYFSAGVILIDNFLKTGKKEILVSAINQIHSPFFVARLDREGKEIGKFWHYGYLPGMYLLDVNNDGRKEVILCGQNDTQDTTKDPYPVVIVLDPTKIIGDTKSTVSPDFSWNNSNAELFYIRLPLTDMNDVLRIHATVMRMEDNGNGEVHFYWLTESDRNKIYFEFYFYFTTNMQIQRVETSPQVESYHTNLVKEGKLAGSLDYRYKENLKEKVQYWDGKEWKNEWTMVKHENLTQGN